MHLYAQNMQIYVKYVSMKLHAKYALPTLLMKRRSRAVHVHLDSWWATRVGRRTQREVDRRRRRWRNQRGAPQHSSRCGHGGHDQL